MRAKKGSAIYRPDLGFYVNEFDSTSLGFVGLKVMPPKKVTKRSGTFRVIPAEVLLSDEPVERAAHGAYTRSTWEYERGFYSVKERGHEIPVDDSEYDELENEQPGLSDQINLTRALNIIYRAQEKRIAKKIFNETRFSPNELTTPWSDRAKSNPVDDIQTGKEYFRKSIGSMPDALIVTHKTFEALKFNEKIRDQLKYTFPGVDLNKLTQQQIAHILDIPELIVAGSVYNSAKKGNSCNIADIWNDNYAALVKISSGADTSSAGFGRTFMYDVDSKDEPIVEQYREEAIRSDILRVRHEVDEQYICSYQEDGTIKTDISKKCIYLFKKVCES